MTQQRVFDIEHLHGLLVHSKAYLATVEDGTAVIKPGVAFGDLKQDTELRADRLLGQQVLRACKNLPGVSRISIESLDDWTDGNDGLWITCDPIDGSLNYKLRGTMLGNPHMTVITVLSKSTDARFDDIIAAGMVDLRPASRDVWLAWKDAAGTLHATLNGEPIKTADVEQLDPGSQVIMAETYYPEHREKFNQLFAGTKGNFNRFGSAAYEMACVSNGMATLFLCDRQKQHELGAAYLLTKAAGGVAIDWNGCDLAEKCYSFDRQTDVILAANKDIASDVLKRMLQAWPPPML